MQAAPPDVLCAFLIQDEVTPGEIESQLETSYRDRLGIPLEVEARLGEAVERLWSVDPEFVDFLVDYGSSAEFGDLTEGEPLRRRFEAAGFGDFFFAPDASQWEDLCRESTPLPEAPFTPELALDTPYSLLASANSAQHQAAIDRGLDPGLDST